MHFTSKANVTLFTEYRIYYICMNYHCIFI